jgi:hypothetical protein
MQSSIPNKFAVLRTHTTRGPYCQVLGSRKLRGTNVFEVENIHFDRSGGAVLETLPIDYKEIYRVQARISNGAIRTFHMWYLPFLLCFEEEEIPILDFHFLGWLPSPQGPAIPLPQSNEVLRVHSEMKQFWNNYQNTNMLSDNSPPHPIAPVPYRAPTPPRSRTNSAASTESAEARSIMTVYPHYNGPPGGDTAFEPMAPSPSTLARPLPIPKFLGDLLIENAQKGEECCTITAMPFKDLESLTATSCFHVFDTTAINRWSRDHNSCPICRTPITNMITKE